MLFSSLLRVESIRPALFWTGAGLFLLAQREVHVDLSNNFHRLSIEKGRLVYPLFHRFQSGWNQQRMAADRLKILNSAVLRNYGSQVYHTRDAGLFGQRRINRLGLPDQFGLLNITADGDALGRGRNFLLWRRRRGRRRRARNRSDNAA